ncbi:MAG: DNA-directed RNA polymerase subunit alpha [Nitrospinota bacterium]
MLLTSRRLVKPRKLETDLKSQTDTYGRFIAEPFERGVGTTIGNSLRRHLLSYITGSAVVAVKFEGIFHEFSSIDGIVEDISEIILNIKQLSLVKEGSDEEDKLIRLQATGEGEVTAGMIETPDQIKILNPKAHIATITDSNASLKIEMLVRSGQGYSPSEEHSDINWDIDVIPVDAIFSPVLNVAFRVEKTRVEQSTDYDRLIIDVTTNGAINPQDAIALAAKNIKDHMQIFINFEEEEEVPVAKINEGRLKIAKNLLKNVEELELSVRSYNCLKNANIKNLVELVSRTETDMLRTRNFGRKSLNEIKEILNELGLNLGMDVEAYREEINILEKDTNSFMM